MDNPTKINELKFCNEYISLSQRYWDLADKEIIEAIDGAMKEVLTNRLQAKNSGNFEGMSEKDIKKYFTAKKLKIYATIRKNL